MKDREKQISRVTWWGAGLNLVLAAVKMLAGVVGNSAAMVADSLHSLSDLASDAVVLAMVKISSKGTDSGHDYGHGKFETLATVCVSLLLIAVALHITAESCKKIILVAQGGELPQPGMIALWAALLSIAVKEALYRWTVRVGRKVESQAVIANAWHHRSDALSSVGALVGIGGGLLLGGKWVVLDPVTGVIIGIVIFAVAVKMTVPAVRELTESSLPEEVETQISDIIRSIDGIQDVHDMKTRRSGRNIILGVHVVVDPSMTVTDAHNLTVMAENALRARFGTSTQISIHVEPGPDAE